MRCGCVLCAHQRLKSAGGDYADMETMKIFAHALQLKNVNKTKLLGSALFEEASLPFFEEILEIPFQLCEHQNE